jgi:hypothetical protein
MTIMQSQAVAKLVQPNKPETLGTPEMTPGEQDTREYLADMLKELGAIAEWLKLYRARDMLQAALHEIEGKQDRS